eukprot:gene30098-35064_t
MGTGTNRPLRDPEVDRNHVSPWRSARAREPTALSSFGSLLPYPLSYTTSYVSFIFLSFQRLPVFEELVSVAGRGTRARSQPRSSCSPTSQVTHYNAVSESHGRKCPAAVGSMSESGSGSDVSRLTERKSGTPLPPSRIPGAAQPAHGHTPQTSSSKIPTTQFNAAALGGVGLGGQKSMKRTTSGPSSLGSLAHLHRPPTPPYSSHISSAGGSSIGIGTTRQPSSPSCQPSSPSGSFTHKLNLHIGSHLHPPSSPSRGMASPSSTREHLGGILAGRSTSGSMLPHAAPSSPRLLGIPKAVGQFPQGLGAGGWEPIPSGVRARNKSPGGKGQGAGGWGQIPSGVCAQKKSPGGWGLVAGGRGLGANSLRGLMLEKGTERDSDAREGDRCLRRGPRETPMLEKGTDA